MSISQDWALGLWDAGYQTVLVPLQKKSPNFAWKRYQTERVPRELVETWFSQGEHNIALISGAISGTVVVDGDSAEACTWIEAMTPPTMKVLTSKGAHYYFQHPGGRVPNSVRAVDEPPIDLRGDGGLTIGPGSLHASGIYYRLAGDGDILSVHDLPMYHREWFPLPEVIQETAFIRPTLLHPSTEEQTESLALARGYLQEVPGAVEGAGGDAHTYVQACRLVRGFNLTNMEALGLLAEWNLKCSPPWAEAELAAKVVHARSYGTGQFGSMLPRANAVPGLLCFGW